MPHMTPYERIVARLKEVHPDWSERKASMEATEGRNADLFRAIKRGRSAFPRGQNLQGLARVLEVDPSWLTELAVSPRKIVLSFDPDAPDEQGGDFRPDARSGVSTDRIYKADVPGASPVIDTRAGAGPGSIGLPALAPSGGVIYSEDAVLGEILLPGYLQQEISRAPPGRVHWVCVRGDSMEPTLKGGDHVAVDTTDSALGQGGMFVARNGDGEIIVKRLYRIPKSDPPQIEVRSDNATLEPPRVVDADWLTIIGRVVAKIGRIG